MSTATRAREASSWAIEYAQESGEPFESAPPGKVRVDLLTDPYSVWCWGLEPVRRTLAHRFPNILFNNLVGGMFEELPDPERLGFDLHRFFASVQRSTGMPIRTEGLAGDRPRSTYPACVHVHAVRLLAPGREDAFLRGLREAAYLDGLNISREEVAVGVAERIGLEGDEFREALATGEPEREFRDRLALLERLDLHAYPTLLFTVGERTARIEGFQPLPTLLNVVEGLSGRVHAARPPPSLDVIVPEGERVATREVAEVLDVSAEEAVEHLEAGVDEGLLERARFPGGDVWSRAA